MKIGFRTAGFSSWTLSAALLEIKDCGYDSVEFCLEHPGCKPELMDDGRVAHVLKLLNDVGLEVSSVSYHGDVEEPEERVLHTLQALDVAQAMGASIFIVSADYHQPGNNRQLPMYLDRLRDLCNRAENYGIDVALEPEPGLLIESSDDFQKAVDAIKSPRLKMNFDIGHSFLTDPDVVQTVHRFRDLIVHTHIEDVAKGVHKHLLAGEGDMNLRAIFAALKEINYPGHLTIDLFNLGDSPGDTARLAIEALRKVLQEPADTVKGENDAPEA